MGRPRKSLTEIQLAGNAHHWSRAQLAARAEEEALPPTDDQQAELKHLDRLIREAMKACGRGQTVRGKRNPAFANLVSLLKARQLIVTHRRPGSKKSSAQLVGEVEAMLKGEREN